MKLRSVASLVLLPPFLILLSTCKNDAVSDAGIGTISGTVLSIDDQSPVDGGVALTLAAPDGDTLVVYLESFFKPGPISEEQKRAYHELQKLSPGDMVSVEVERKGDLLFIRAIARK